MTRRPTVGPDPVFALYATVDGPAVACVQDFDMDDYNDDNWLTARTFPTEQEAQVVLGLATRLIKRGLL